jgi:hypothetical protein
MFTVYASIRGQALIFSKVLSQPAVRYVCVLKAAPALEFTIGIDVNYSSYAICI